MSSSGHPSLDGAVSGGGPADTGLGAQYSPFRPIEVVDGFPVIERMYSDDPAGLSVGLANVSAEVPDIEANKRKIVRIAQIFKERKVNFAVFPEFSLSGYFWEDEPSCRPYMNEAAIENHTAWIEQELEPLLDDQFQGIVLNNVSDRHGDKFFNRTFVVTRDLEYLDPRNTYDKVFLPGIEKTYTESGRDDRLVLTGERGRFGFTTCYDCLFSELLREYAIVDQVDAIVEIASWRAAASRDYPGLNVRTDHYYGELWDTVLAAAAAVNQVWVIACNAVGSHGVSGALFWGGSGIWAPSGLRLIQGSHFSEELLVVHNLDIKGARKAEQDDFDYAIDFNEIYRPMEGSRTFTRRLD
jgi:predicted amidohydrolase